MVNPSFFPKSKAPPPPEFSLRVKLLNTLVHYFPRRSVPKRLVKNSAKFTSHLLVLEKSIERNIKTDLPSDFEFTIATPSDIELIARHEEGLEFNVYQKRSHQNDFCCILKLNSVIVIYSLIPPRYLCHHSVSMTYDN